MSGVHRPSRKSTDFTIARILSDDRTDHSNLRCINPVQLYPTLDRLLRTNDRNNSEHNQHLSVKDSGTRNSDSLFVTTRNLLENTIIDSTSTDKTHQGDLDRKSKDTLSAFPASQTANSLNWLQCTRYQPPKLPRKSFTERVARRRSAAHPRIPFTSYQLQVLEDKYKSSAYLSRKDVIQLSTTLRIPNSRIKIWFQNRRARDRRETKVTCSLSMD